MWKPKSQLNIWGVSQKEVGYRGGSSCYLRKKNQERRANKNYLPLLLLSFYLNMSDTQCFSCQLSNSDRIKGMAISGLCNNKRMYGRKSKNYVYSLFWRGQKKAEKCLESERICKNAAHILFHCVFVVISFCLLFIF